MYVCIYNDAKITCLNSLLQGTFKSGFILLPTLIIKIFTILILYIYQYQIQKYCRASTLRRNMHEKQDRRASYWLEAQDRQRLYSYIEVASGPLMLAAHSTKSLLYIQIHMIIAQNIHKKCNKIKKLWKSVSSYVIHC